ACGAARAGRHLCPALPVAVRRLGAPAGAARGRFVVTGRGLRALLVAALVAVTACGQPLYVAPLRWNHAESLWRRAPIHALIAHPETDPDLRERLALVLAARQYARDRLGFNVGESYASFAEVAPHEATVHVVSAARRDRLEASTWWYPIAGR